MTQATNGNVVPLSNHPRAQARLSARESADVLTGCRDLALERITLALSGMLDKVEDELFTLAEKTSDRGAQNVYLDARAKTRGKRKVMETSFRQYFVELFNKFDAKQWTSLVKQMDDVMTAWEQAVEAADDKKVAEWGSTIAHIGAHNAYHIGQIVYIRKLQGSWNADKGVK